MDKYSRLIATGAIAAMLLVILFISTSTKKSNTIPLNDYAVDITSARLASAKNALDGTGELTETQCQSLGKLAKEHSPSSDFLDCSSPDSIYLATPDTAMNKVLTLSDDTYTAVFSTDKEYTMLTNYEFKNEATAGFNKYGGRK